MNKYFEEFKKTGKVKDYLLYRSEMAKEFVKEDEKRGDNNKSNGLSRKP